MSIVSDASSIKVYRSEYRGWKNAYNICNDSARLIVLTDIGPRILFYGFLDGENEFHEVPEHAGLTTGNEFRSYGGHRFWVAPEVERTYYPDNAQVSISRGDEAITFTAPIEATPPGTNLQKEIEIKLDDTGTHVTVTHRIFNRGNEATEMAPWALSVMAPGGKAILPLPPRAPVSKDRLQPEGVVALWSYTDFADPRWTIGTKYIQLKQSSSPNGQFKEQMAGIYNPSGWGAYFRDGNLFVKRSKVQKGARYPDFGCNFEIYTEPGFLELETLGPLQSLAPGGTIQHMEEWWIVPNGDGDTWADSIVLPIVESMLRLAPCT